MTIIICVPGEPLLILVRLLLVIGYGIMGSIAFRVLALSLLAGLVDSFCFWF
jgi:hypothetical protein